jgi:hypothetical protein
MSRRKRISKNCVSGSSERAELLALMTIPWRSDKCRYKDGDLYLCQLPPLQGLAGRASQRLLRLVEDFNA